MQNTILPLDVPIIAWFSYLSDCQVKIPVCLKEKNGLYFMKNPVKPQPDWKLNLIIRAIDFPENHSVKFMRSPFNETDYWESQVKKKAAHSEFAEIYEITEPQYFSLNTNRKALRIFCLLPIKCQVGENNNFVKATCIDMTDDGSGLGLRFDTPLNLQIGMSCKIQFESPPLEPNLPEITAQITRQSVSALDRSITVGLIIAADQQYSAKICVQNIAKYLISQSEKEASFTPTNLDYPAYKGLANDVLDSFKGFN
jgi:hypothetical protein